MFVQHVTPAAKESDLLAAFESHGKVLKIERLQPGRDCWMVQFMDKQVCHCLPPVCAPLCHTFVWAECHQWPCCNDLALFPDLFGARGVHCSSAWLNDIMAFICAAVWMVGGTTS